MTKGLNGRQPRREESALRYEGWEDYPCRRMQCNPVVSKYLLLRTTLEPDSSDASRLVIFGRWALGISGRPDGLGRNDDRFTRSSVTEGEEGGTQVGRLRSVA